VIGCSGGIGMMPLFRLAAFYPIEGHYEFPSVVQSVLGEKFFGVTLFLPDYVFPLAWLFLALVFCVIKYSIQFSL
jgi:hypothetical protein